MTANGRRVLVAFRPKQRWRDDRPLDRGIAYMVVTVREGRITEMKGCVTRSSALEYAQTGHTSEPRTDRVRPPDVTSEPAAHRVNRLVPLIRVADVDRSVAFYEHLGFVVTSMFKPRDRRLWVAMSSESAGLMLERTSSRSRDRTGVVFYLYSHDLAALRQQLLDNGIAAGEIVDGTPGPRYEMELTDPDGYTVMVAQIDEPDGQ